MAAAEGLPLKTIYERVASDIPLRRYGTAEEVAALVAFLASPVSADTAGQNVLVDGGLYRAVCATPLRLCPAPGCLESRAAR
jgi:NAD(P)-dependent dehydrogenase (short-subunit alcohol dehydrogenase family)